MGLEEVMPLETCGATQATSPNENIEEMVKNSDCTESYMKTTGPVLSPLSRAEKSVHKSGINPASEKFKMITSIIYLSFLFRRKTVSEMNCSQTNQIQKRIKYQMSACLMRNTYPTHKGMMMIIQMQVSP
ncbi:hypothetical protein KUCAC02_005986 [Chaenocephalus aceratus]|uniref:Uncharacterized protein n=1 Tax=Chaenocephalus aceratus TaxID=36190 RepID=A0ACB9WQ84_CHAAC|nr:hypothetical protein KUCAC02_005986 [Chaenocephalus aceratus]